jgi:hypothetical protein
VFLIVIWILLLTSSLYFLEVLLAVFSDSQGLALLSTNWAGYIVTPNLENPSDQVIGINASWIVPEITVFSSNAYSTAWIGIGGFADRTLIQTGTEHNSLNGQEYYSAWYELLPDEMIRIDTIKVSPGDLITASITLVNSEINQWAIRIQDITSGQGFCQTFIYDSWRSSAQWIVERQSVGGNITPLANFGTITFIDSYVKVGDNIGSITGFSHSQIIMTTDLSKQLTSVSPLGADGASFSVTYLASS